MPPVIFPILTPLTRLILSREMQACTALLVALNACILISLLQLHFSRLVSMHLGSLSLN